MELLIDGDIWSSLRILRWLMEPEWAIREEGSDRQATECGATNQIDSAGMTYDPLGARGQAVHRPRGRGD